MAANQEERGAIQPIEIGTKNDLDRAQMFTGRAAGGGLVPRTFDDLWRLSRVMAASGMMPTGITKPEQVFVAVQHGLEVGLSPMQAVQSIAVVNGRPTLWGDAAAGLVRASGLCDWITEEPISDHGGKVIGYRCTTQRRGEPAPISREFTTAMAAKAGLLGKKGPWESYPERMLQMRARSWALRDAYQDVLKGLAIREEAQDVEIIAPEPAATIDDQKVHLRNRLDAIRGQSANEAVEVEAVESEMVVDEPTAEEIAALNAQLAAEEEATRKPERKGKAGQLPLDTAE